MRNNFCGNVAYVCSVKITQVSGTDSQVVEGNVNGEIVSQRQLVLERCKPYRAFSVAQRKDLIIGLSVRRREKHSQERVFSEPGLLEFRTL